MVTMVAMVAMMVLVLVLVLVLVQMLVSGALPFSGRFAIHDSLLLFQAATRAVCCVRFVFTAARIKEAARSSIAAAVEYVSSDSARCQVRWGYSRARRKCR